MKKNIYLVICCTLLALNIFAGNRSGKNVKCITSEQTTVKFELPALPYGLDALEPHMSKQTLEYHYGKHHKTYVDNLNKLIVGTSFENTTSLEEIVKKSEGPIFNNAAQVWNHTFFWNCLSPNGGGEPQGALADAIKKQFGSYDEFKQKFATACTSLFGSGWVWLVKNTDGTLEIVQTKNAETPITTNKTPLFCCDVWEHAYYLDKQNRRGDFVVAFWNVIDWKTIGTRF